jgi:replicative DNA helicase
MHSRDLCLIGARPSIGKTTFALSVALKAARRGTGVGIISLEMDADKLAARAASDLAYDSGVKVTYQDIIRRRIDKPNYDLIASFVRSVTSLPFWIEDQPGLSIADIRVKLEAMLLDADRAGAPLRALVIDHLGLILPTDRYPDNRAQQVGETTAALKGLAREYDIAILLLSQLNRGVESRDSKRPTLGDLRDSGSIEQDADTVMFLYRDAYYLERERRTTRDGEAERLDRLIGCRNSMELAIAKQRNGPAASIELFVDMPFSAVRNAARH